MYLIIDKLMDTIFLCKAFNEIILMFIDSFEHIICYANIECAIFFARQYINKKNLHLKFWIPAFAGMTNGYLKNSGLVPVKSLKAL